MSNKNIIPDRIRVHYWGVQELMATMLGKIEQFENDLIEDLEGEFYDEFEVDADAFHKIVEYLIPYTSLSESPLTGKLLIGFANHNENIYITKQVLEIGGDND